MKRAPTTTPRVLIVAPPGPSAGGMIKDLEAEGYAVALAEGEVEGALKKVCRQNVDLIVLDHDMTGVESGRWLSRLQNSRRPASVILIGDPPAPEVAIQALRAGAFDFLIKPVPSGKFLESVRQAIENRRSFHQIISLSERLKVANKTLSKQKRCLEHERDLLVKRNRDLDVLNQIGHDLVGSLQADEIIQVAINRTADLVLYDLLAVAWLPGERVWGHACRAGESGRLAAYQQATLERARMYTGPFSGRKASLSLREDRREVEIALRVTGQRQGLVRFRRHSAQPGFDPYEIEVLSTLTNSLALALRGADAHQEAQNLAVTDGLTDLLNRRAFTNALDREFKKAVRYGYPLGMLLIDVDHFKAINDRFGHQAGDSVLRQLAVFVKQTLREVDVAARYGGEEFAVIMPGTGPSQAVFAAERIRQAIAGHTFLPECRDFRVTVSIGVSQYQGEGGTSPEDLIRDADIALYRAKTNGRNRVEVTGFAGRLFHPAFQSLQPTVQ